MRYNFAWLGIKIEMKTVESNKLVGDFIRPTNSCFGSAISMPGYWEESRDRKNPARITDLIHFFLDVFCSSMHRARGAG